MQEQKIQTEFGTLWTACNHLDNNFKSNPTIICLHGNGFDSRIFKPLLNSSELNDHYQVILFDYPGHGRSEDAPDPDKAYFQCAYAEAALKVLQHYNVTTVIPIGWSLGGNVALEFIPLLATPKNTTNIRIAGAVLTGAAPVPKQQIKGFRADADMSALFNPQASPDELTKIAGTITKSHPTPTWLVDSVIRTNRSAGIIMATKFMEGNCSDQIQVVHNFKDGWIAFIHGADEPFLDLDYCDDVCQGAPRLWRGKCIRVPGQGHAPFYDDPDTYNL